MYYSRTVEEIILKTHQTFPVLLLTGARQVGKTTVLKHCADKVESAFSYVSLDTLENRRLADEDPALFLERYAPPLIIDEIQYAPNLLPYIKQEVDQRGQNGLYWLTGSQQFNLMQKVSESLAGRIGIVRLAGFSLNELRAKPGRPIFLPSKDFFVEAERTLSPITSKDLFYQIWRGSFPRLQLNPKPSWDQFYDSYVTTYIERDIRSMLGVSDLLAFSRFIRICAARTGQLLNYADLAKETGVTLPTTKSWLSLLVSSGLVYLLEPWFSNIEKRVVKTPKLYFLDTGLAAWLSGWQTPQTLELGAMSGAFLETFVLSELLKGYWHYGRRPRLYFYRDYDQKEIDFLIEENNILYPLEVKAKTNPSKDDIRHFSILERTKRERGQGAVFSLASTYLPIDVANWSVPIWYI